MNKAAIEITPSSVKLLILSAENEPLCPDVRSYQQKNQGALISPENVQEVQDYCSELIEIARLHNIPVWQIVGIATGMMRNVFNARSIFQRLRAELNLTVHLLTEEEEGSYGWFGSLKGLPYHTGAAAMLSLQKESITAVLGLEGRIDYIHNIPLDCGTYTTNFFGFPINRYGNAENIAFRKALALQTATLHWPTRPRTLIVAGESVLALSALEKGLPTTQYGDIHGFRFTRAVLRRWQDRLLSSTRSTRKNICAAYPEYAEQLLGLTYTLEQLCSRSFRDSFLVSEGGTSLGVLLSRKEL